MVIKKQQSFLFGFLFIFLIFSSFITFYDTLDPDFGWHIKTGQLILERGAPKVDWYSYTMPNFPWVDHEWLLDVVMYKVYYYFGSHVLLFLFLFFYTLAFFVIKKPKQEFISFFIPVTLGYLATFYFLGIRPQLLGILLIAILIKIIDDFLEKSSKLVYTIPLIFLLWVNIHASFFAGLVILGIIIFLELFKKIKIWQKFPPAPRLRRAGNFLKFFDSLTIKEISFEKIKTLVAVLIASFLATLINPYFFGVYEEVFRTTGDNFLRFNITEWLPLFFSGFKPFIYFYGAVFIGLMALYYKKVELNKIILSLFFLALSLSGIRYTLIFIIISLPVLIDLMDIFIKEASFRKNYHLVAKTYRAIFVILAVLIVAIFVYGIYDFYSGMFGSEFYPKDALPFIKTIPLEDHILNYYGWGGYLILNMPERKYFIDGRMPSWRQGDDFAFGNYVEVTKAKEGFEKYLEKYDIKYIIFPKSIKDKYEESKNDIAGQRVKEFFKKYKILSYLFGIDTNNSFYEKLKEFSWSEIYMDNTTIILKK